MVRSGYSLQKFRGSQLTSISDRKYLIEIIVVTFPTIIKSISPRANRVAKGTFAAHTRENDPLSTVAFKSVADLNGYSTSQAPEFHIGTIGMID